MSEVDYLKVSHLSVEYQNIESGLSDEKVISDINLSVNEGEIFGIVGPTGCGKTILLKTIAGLIKPDEGEVIINGVNINKTPPYKRGMSMVFQDYALYPHMSVKKNILFPFRFKKQRFEVSPKARLDEIAKILHLDEAKILDRKHRSNLFTYEHTPKTISGGERQRVAIGKAIAVLPDALLLDEPLSNIEENLRREIRHKLRSIVKEHGITAIYVSHNQEEIALIADRMAVLNHGRIEQTGTYMELYNNPKKYFVSLFIGEKSTNYLRDFEVKRYTNGKLDKRLTIRPHECSLEQPKAEHIALSGKVIIVEAYLDEKKKSAFIEVGGNLFGVELSIDSVVKKGDNITIYVPFDKAKFFNENEERSG